MLIVWPPRVLEPFVTLDVDVEAISGKPI